MIYKIFPNPVKEIVRISNIHSETHVEIIRMDGVKIFTTHTFNDVEINTNTWSKGMYIILLQEKWGKKSAFKIMKV